MSALRIVASQQLPEGFDAVAHLETRIREFEEARETIYTSNLVVAESVMNWIDHRISELFRELEVRKDNK